MARRARGSGGTGFTQRVLMTVGIVTAAVIAGFLLWYGAQVVLLIFTGLLLAVLLRSLSVWLRDHTPLSDGWALAVVVVGLIALVTLGIWLVIPTIAAQGQQLSEQLPQAFTRVRQRLDQIPWINQLLSQVGQPQQLLPESTNVLGRVTGVFSTVLGSVANIVIILFVGVYLAVDPGLYQRGVIHLIPRGKRARANEVLHTLGYTLRWWLLGRLSIMTINGILTALGLWFLGVPLPMLNGIITGTLNFIPNIGPFLAAVPAILLALAQDPMTALYTILLYLFIQNLEGFILTPLVQQQTVELPPVLILSAQIVFGICFGFLGVLLAVPLTAVGFVLIKMLYVEDALGDAIEVKGEEEVKHVPSPPA